MNIAYISEFSPIEKITGKNIKDLKLPPLLEKIGDVKRYYADVTKYNKYEYLLNNGHIPELINEVNHNDFDIVIITCEQISPYLLGYKKIRHPKIIWFCDSAYFMHKNISWLNIKEKLKTAVFMRKEGALIKTEKCAYLGKDEIDNLPKKYRKNAVIIPFYIPAKEKNYFNPQGHILYIADFNYWPNRKALRTIMAVAPYINAPIKIFGRNIPVIKNIPQNVSLCGYAESLDGVYTGAKALLYPVNFGTGIKNKVIEAMSYGIPVIGFRYAFTNMNVIHNKNCIIIKNLKELLAALNRKDLAIISKNAHSYIQTEMTEEKALDQVKRVIAERIAVD